MPWYRRTKWERIRRSKKRLKDPEYRGWYEIARELKQPVQRLRQETTSTEYNDWLVFLDEEREREWYELSLDHYYLAQVALEVVRMAVNADAAKTLTLDQFLIKFQEKKKEKQKTPEELTEYTKQQKVLFAGIFGAPLPPGEL